MPPCQPFVRGKGPRGFQVDAERDTAGHADERHVIRMRKVEVHTCFCKCTAQAGLAMRAVVELQILGRDFDLCGEQQPQARPRRDVAAAIGLESQACGALSFFCTKQRGVTVEGVGGVVEPEESQSSAGAIGPACAQQPAALARL
jgi:hypothetical protein